MKPETKSTSAEGVPSLHRHEAHSVKESDEHLGLIEVDGKEVNEVEEDAEEGAGCQAKSDKKTDEALEPQKPAGGYLWRFSSGVIGTTSGAVTGAVGLGFGGIKWVATKGYNAGSAVVGTTKTVASKVPIPAWKKKDKKE